MKEIRNSKDNELGGEKEVEKSDKGVTDPLQKAYPCFNFNPLTA